MQRSHRNLFNLGICIIAIALCFFAARLAFAKLVEVSELAPGIFVHFGKHEQPDSANQGNIANIGFIVGSEAIAVVDSGGSLSIGRELKNAIREVSSLPVRYVIITHVHPDHALGTSPFLDMKPEIIGHHRLPNAILQRGSFYVEQSKEALGDQEVETIVAPTLLVESEMTIDLGQRKLLIRAHETAHTDNDLSIFDYNTKTLWLSDLLFVERIPALDGSVTGWIRLLNSMQNINADLVIPGHGSAVRDWPSGASKMLAYLENLVAAVRELLQQGKSAGQALKLAESENSDGWLLFRDNHPRNVLKAYSELEWE